MSLLARNYWNNSWLSLNIYCSFCNGCGRIYTSIPTPYGFRKVHEKVSSTCNNCCKTGIMSIPLSEIL